MAVTLIGVVVVAAAAISLGVSLWRRSQHRPKTPIHSEFGPDPYRAAATAPAAEPERESYYARASPSNLPTKGRPMGWYSVDGGYDEERYWDGHTWTARRKKVSGAWSAVPVGGD